MLENVLKINLSKDSDEIIALRAKSNECAFEYLLNKYMNLIYHLSNQYFIVGANKEDIIQEGIIGFYKAIKSFSSEHGRFRGFVILCIKRQLITTIKNANRHKHAPLNKAYSYDMKIFTGEKRLFEMIVDSNADDPEAMLIQRENFKILNRIFTHILSNRELSVLELYYQGYSYAEISEDLGINIKSVDTALSRARKKIKSDFSIETLKQII